MSNYHKVALVSVLRSYSLTKSSLTPTELTYHHESLFLRCKEKLFVGVELRRNRCREQGKIAREQGA